MQPHKSILRRLVKAHSKLVAGGGLIAVLLSVGLVASIGWAPHASMTVTNTSVEVLPDGATIRQSATFDVYNNGLVEITPVIGLRRDATLVSTCAGSEVLTQAQVDKLTAGRYIEVLGHDDVPVIGRPLARYFIVLPQRVLLPGQQESCSVNYDFVGAVDQPHAILFDGIFPGGMIPLGLADTSWDEPRPPLYIQAAPEPSTVDDNGILSEHLNLSLYQPGEAAYLVTVKRGGPNPQIRFVCTGDNVVAVDMGNNSYLITLQGKALCEVTYPLSGPPGMASFDFEVFSSQSKPKVIGNGSWIES